jgi:hypothetical protein
MIGIGVAVISDILTTGLRGSNVHFFSCGGPPHASRKIQKDKGIRVELAICCAEDIDIGVFS